MCVTMNHLSFLREYLHKAIQPILKDSFQHCSSVFPGQKHSSGSSEKELS